jgi:hypothetical protein
MNDMSNADLRFAPCLMRDADVHIRCCAKKYYIVFLRSVHSLLVTANIVPSSPILITLMMEALHSSETSNLTRVTWWNVPEDGILHCHCRENL